MYSFRSGMTRRFAMQARGQIVQERIDHRCSQQRERQRQSLAAGSKYGDRTAFFCAGACANQQRQHARHEADRGHQDRPQSISIGLQDRGLARHALRTQLVGVIHLQNRVLLHHAKQNENASAAASRFTSYSIV